VSVGDLIELTVRGTTYAMALPGAEVDYIQRHIATTGEPYEIAMLEDLASRLDPGDLVVDAGANVGNHTLFLAMVARCRVEAFEPDTELAEIIERSVAANDASSLVRVHRLALGDRAGVGRLVTVDPANRGAQHMELGTGDVRVVALDDADIRRPVRALKIDVEGMELSVLRGADRLVREDRPLLYVECADESAFGQVAEWLDERDYVYWETFNATPTHLFRPAEDVDPEQATRRLMLRGARIAYRTTKTIADLRSKLDAANLKYRSAGEHHRALRERFDEARAQVEELEARRAEVEAALEAARDEAEALRAEKGHLLAEQERERREKEAHVSALEERLAAAERRAGEASARADLLAAQVERLEAELAAGDRGRKELEGRLAAAEEAASASERRLAAESARVALLSAQLGDSARDLRAVREERAQAARELSLERAEAAAAAARAAGQRSKLEARVTELKARLREASRELAAARDDVVRAQAGRAELAGTVETLRDEVDRWARRADDLTSSLESARREAADLTREVGIARRREETLRAEIAAVSASRDAASADAEKAWAAAEAAHERAQAAERKVKDLRASVTYRTGRAVRDALSSPRAFLRLPVTLWRLRRERRAAKPVPTAAGPTVVGVHAQVPASRAPEVAGRPATAAVTQPGPASVRRPRIAAIVDEFTGLSLAPDCDLIHLTPQGWREALQEARPDLLFVESAWRGYQGSWHNTVPRLPDELRQIIRWCRDRGIPTAFWNKEDPVHYTTFLTTAREFDHVFTTDLDCVPRYKAALGHDRVYLLPFAAQPRLYNPIEEAPRKDAFCFAGAYYRRYPERTRDLDEFLEHLPTFRPIEIFDRNFGGADENYMFPEQYQSFIVGTLPPEKVAEAYRRYRFGLNLNSVKQSQSMFARRVFELLASNTITVSNFSRGVRVMFGDLVVCTDSGPEAVRRLRDLDEDPARLDKVRLAALRSVMSQHTYADRLSYVLAKATGAAAPDPLPGVLVIGRAAGVEEAKRIEEAVARQEGVRTRLLLVVDDGVEGVPAAVRSIAASAAADVRVCDVAQDDELVALVHPDDYYGPRYLHDLALATRYAEADVFGKRTRFRMVDGEVRVVDVDSEYRRCGRLPLRSSVATGAALGARTLGDLLDDIEAGLHDAADQVALDRFSYCQDGATADGVPALVDDADVWTGVPLAEIQAAAEETTPAPGPGEGQRSVDATTLMEWFGNATRPDVVHRPAPGGWLIESQLADDKHEYVYAPRPVPVAELWPNGVAHAFVDAVPGLDLQFVFIFQDGAGERVGILWAPSQHSASALVPEGAATVKVGIRVRGPGITITRSIVLEPVVSEPQVVVATSRDVIVTNHYPSYGDLYRNGFVHSRVRAYKRHGVRPEVYRVRPGNALSFGEFEGVDVATGSAEALRRRFSSDTPRAVMVHFLDPAMWDVLRELDVSVPITVWVHGAEIHAWWRRAFNHDTPEKVAAAEEAWELRKEFWAGVFAEHRPNVHFVFVSAHFASEALDDLGVVLEPSRYSVVHNPIDVETFVFRQRRPEERLRFLSIRPFASPQYANDLTVAAIMQLAEEPWFPEAEFRIIGDGPLFESTVEPLRAYENVKLERRFLSQGEIARLHQEYGVFLVPTRWDSQGVSRDEAMASGMVPVTTGTAAVPEFVDSDSGVVVAEGDPAAIAEAVRRLVADPERFVRLSIGAGERVRSQCSAHLVVPKELSLALRQGGFRPRDRSDPGL